ncbi:MAG: rhamnulokinase [Lachnospiraceae bacterium]|nr:rhamnulokinase [Lachnospiraceae bacterium]
MENVLAFDLGASSGRGILAGFDGEKISLEEIHRFPHNFSTLNGRAYWDVLFLMDSMKDALVKAPKDIKSIGFDTWGVDAGFIGKKGELVSLVGSYRDTALDDINMKHALEKIAMAKFADGGKDDFPDRSTLEKGERIAFENTGIASLAYNTIYKLYFIRKNMPYVLENADKMLLMPNLFEYLFSGVSHTEYSIGSTSQLYDMKHHCWSEFMIESLELPRKMFTKVDLAGEVLGNLLPDIQEFTGQKLAKVTSVSGHDTACAVAAVPAEEDEFTFLSSGTWSLMGISSKTMLEGEEVIKSKISNEGTYDGGYRPTVNITGLWIVQQLRRNFAKEGREYDFGTMAKMACEAGVSKSYINPDDFMQEGNYIKLISEKCAETGQKVPENDAELISVVLTSLALKYRQVYESFKPFIHWDEKLYIVGGGVQNEVLCQYTANALKIPVYAGASEATAVGNVMQQFKSMGVYETKADKCAILAKSFDTKLYTPENTDAWDEAYEKYLKVV